MRIALIISCGVAMLAAASPAFAKEKPPTIQYDPYQKTEMIVGDDHLHNALLDLDKSLYWFAGTVTNGVPGNPILMFSMDSPEWFFFESAADIEGNQFRVIQGNRDLTAVGGVTVHELVGVVMSPAYLQAHRTTGMDLKIIGSRGDKVVKIAPETVATFDDVYEREIAKFGGVPSTQKSQGQDPTAMADAMQKFGAVGAEAAAKTGGIGVAFLPSPAGLVLMGVAPGSVAASSGLKVGQVIESANGIDLRGMPSAAAAAVLKALPTKRIVFKVVAIGNVTLIRP